MTNAPPIIFSQQRKQARRERASAIFEQGASDWFLLDHMVEDAVERLAFMRHDPVDVFLDGTGSQLLVSKLPGDQRSFTPVPHDLDSPPPVQSASFDLVASINALDTVNDLPGALIQMRELLRPGGVALASFVGGTSLPALRRAMFEAEPDRPAARIHPMIDPRSCPGLLSRAGWRNPVVDSYVLTVRYSSLASLLADLRGQALGSVLANPGPPLGKAAYARAQQAFMAQADEDGKVSETFEIVALTGSR
ncbi:methyltransferase domain-containing protein [Aurantiacibacter gangjinensis]|uniref:Uncharacterized protein n=1 Tax=Aurantiacibacter gangjinensis TaxID=502682 RepID=A0A0G9MQ75_9SPHN|nr:methyltransferase domain-containing protein [Aurantiacibacter gangjinensis]APE28725.1 SAM-dependent methyltransferase, BioC-like [Aurantiacibacter gangjinensis]KLE32886.1 hypothetical protein AAW01_02375 [Aurantiacibacter gangjinensis]